MFDKVFELLRSIWEHLIPFVLLREYHRGVVLRAGVWHRDLGPGFHWVFPRLTGPRLERSDRFYVWTIPYPVRVQARWLGRSETTWLAVTITFRVPDWRFVAWTRLQWEECIYESVVTDIVILPAQPLTTSDDVPITIQPSIESHVVDARKLLLTVEGKDRALHSLAAGVIAREVARTTWDVVRTEAFAEVVWKAIRKRGFRFGIEVDEVQFVALQKTRSLMLLQPPAPPPASA